MTICTKCGDVFSRYPRIELCEPCSGHKESQIAKTEKLVAALFEIHKLTSLAGGDPLLGALANVAIREYDEPDRPESAIDDTP